MPGKPLSQILVSILSDPSEAQKYGGLRSIAIPIQKVQISLYPRIFQLLFEQDARDVEGWWHTVPQGYRLDDKSLDLWTIALAGASNRKEEVLKHPKNARKKLPLSGGDRIFFPSHIFTPELKLQLQKTTGEKEKTGSIVIEPIDIFDEEIAGNAHTTEINGSHLSKDLEYQGAYVIYKLKPGETIYETIIRFTDFSEHADIMKASEIIKKQNKILNERTLKPGTPIKIPVDMLSDMYMPGGTEERRIADEVRKEVEQIKKSKSPVKTTDELRDVVIIIDPGHGGRDHGAPKYTEKILEDEINYDIACRLKEYLEQKTRARIYVTLEDKSQGFKPVSNRTFVHDTDEYVRVTPPHNPQWVPVSSNLRWLLANDIVSKERKTNIPHEKMIYISIHCDVLYKSSIRGMMIYIPGANYYSGVEKIPQKNRYINYGNFKEWQGYHPESLSVSERINIEARSKAFAQTLIVIARKNGIVVHSNGPAIRNVIRKSKYSAYVPSVLRNTNVPTKVLIECANLNNSADLKNVSDPKWRQKMAETIAEALSAYFAR